MADEKKSDNLHAIMGSQGAIVYSQGMQAARTIIEATEDGASDEYLRGMREGFARAIFGSTEEGLQHLEDFINAIIPDTTYVVRMELRRIDARSAREALEKGMTLFLQTLARGDGVYFSAEQQESDGQGEHVEAMLRVNVDLASATLDEFQSCK